MDARAVPEDESVSPHDGVVTAIQSVLPSAGPKEMPTMQAVHKESAVAVPYASTHARECIPNVQTPLNTHIHHHVKLTQSK